MAKPLDDDRKSLIFTSRISQSEKNALFAYGEAYPESGLKERFQRTIEPVVLNRMMLAQGALEVARMLLAQPQTEAVLRAVINRAYYAIHHSIRAIMLYKYQSEADGHEEAIKELENLLKDKTDRARCGLDEFFFERAIEARDNRSIADYSPFDWSRREGTVTWFNLTDDSWKSAAEFNVAVAEQMYIAAYRYL